MEDASQTPSVLQYSSIKPMANPPSALTHVRLIPSTGETYTPGQNIRIPIALPQDSLADMNRAFITYKIKNTSGAGATAYFDPQVGGASVIDIFRVVSGTGSLLDEIIQYSNYCSALYTHDGDQHVKTIRNIYLGVSNNPIESNSIGTKGSASATVTNPIDAAGKREFLEHDGSRHITHYPYSSVFKADKLLPFSFAQGVSYVDMTLCQAESAFCFSDAFSGTPKWEISDVKLHVPILQLPSDFASSFRQLLASGIPVQVHSIAAQNTQQSKASGGGAIVATFASRKRSVKSLLLTTRVATDITSMYADSMSCRRSLGVTQWDFTVGGVRMPSTQIELGKDKQGETLAHANNAIGHNSTLNGMCAQDENYYLTDNLIVTVAGTIASANATTLTLGLANSSVAAGQRVVGDGIAAGTRVTAVSSTAVTLSCPSTKAATTSSSYEFFDGRDNSNQCSKIVYGLDLEAYKDTISGYNLSGNGLPIVWNANAGTESNLNASNERAVILSLYVIHDVMISIDGISGTMSASS